MADCKRSQIPEALILSKGEFHCTPGFIGPGIPNGFDGHEYLPPQGDISARLIGFAAGQFPFPTNITAALSTALTQTITLTNTQYSDELMSWQSDPIIFPDSNPRGENLSSHSNVACECCDFGPASEDDLVYFSPDEHPCVEPEELVDDDIFTGQVVNWGWYGVTVQFFVNVYKVYCCVYNDVGDVIDFDYFFYFSVIMVRDGAPCVDGYGPLGQAFCSKSSSTQSNHLFITLRTET